MSQVAEPNGGELWETTVGNGVVFTVLIVEYWDEGFWGAVYYDGSGYFCETREALHKHLNTHGFKPAGMCGKFTKEDK